MQMNTEEWQRVFLLCGISVVRVLSSPFFSVFLFAVQMTAIKAGQTRAKHRAPLNVISSRRERNKGRSDSSGRERDKPLILKLSTSKRCSALFIGVFISAFAQTWSGRTSKSTGSRKH